MNDKEREMRSEVESIYSRQVARCLSDIKELYDLPSMAIDRIKKAIEYTAKDVDKVNKGIRNGIESNGNR